MYRTLIPFYLKSLNEGIRVPIKISEDEWGEKYIGYQELLKSYCTMTVARLAFLSEYKHHPQIETIPNEDKIEWRKFVNEVFPGTLPEFRLEALKIIYTIGVLTS